MHLMAPKFREADPEKTGNVEQPRPREQAPEQPAPVPQTPDLAEGPPPGADPADPDLTMDDADDAPTNTAHGDVLPPAASSPQPLSAEEGVEMEDTAFFYGNDPDDGDAQMTSALPGAFQIVGVDPVIATRAAYARVKKRRPTMMELYGRGTIVHGANVSFKNLNVHGLDALDLRTLKPSGQPWDFTKTSDHRLALWLVRTRKPTWMIGSPPCTAFSSLMHLNKKKMSPQQFDAMLREGRLHLHSMIQIYVEQIKNHGHFLHEHPQGATSWVDPIMKKLLEHPAVHSVVGHQCEFGLTTPDADGRPMVAKKPTRFATSSVHMAPRLGRRCTGTHPHQQLVAGRAASAAFYPPGLTLEILRGIRDTADMAPDQCADESAPPQLEKAMISAGLFHDQAAPLSAVLRIQDLQKQCEHIKVNGRVSDGSSTAVPLSVKDMYRDEYTSEALPHGNICEAMSD